jgi:hypothetical protein
MKLYAIDGFHNIPGLWDPTKMLQDLWQKKKKALSFLLQYQADQEYLDQVSRKFEPFISLPSLATPDFSAESSIHEKKHFYAHAVCTYDYCIKLEKEEIKSGIDNLIRAVQVRISEIESSWKRYIPLLLSRAKKKLESYENHRFYLNAICHENTADIDICLSKFIKHRLGKMKQLNKTFFFREKLLKEVKQLDFYITHLEQIKKDREFPELPRSTDLTIQESLEPTVVSQAFWFESAEERKLLKDIRTQMTEKEQDEYLAENERKCLYAERWVEKFMSKLIEIVRGPDKAEALKLFLMINKSYVYLLGEAQGEHLKFYIELRGYVRRILGNSLDEVPLKYLSRICHAFEEVRMELGSNIAMLKHDQANFPARIKTEKAFLAEAKHKLLEYNISLERVMERILMSNGYELMLKELSLEISQDPEISRKIYELYLNIYSANSVIEEVKNRDKQIATEIITQDAFMDELKQFEKHIYQQAIKKKGKKLVRLKDSLAKLKKPNVKYRYDQLTFLEELFLIKTPDELLIVIEKFADFFYKKKSNFADLFLYMRGSPQYVDGKFVYIGGELGKSIAVHEIRRIYKVFDKCANKTWNNDFLSNAHFTIFHKLYHFFHYGLLEKQSDIHKNYWRRNPEVRVKPYDIQQEGETIKVFPPQFLSNEADQSDMEVLVKGFILTLSLDGNKILNLMGTFKSDNSLVIYSLSQLNSSIFDAMFSMVLREKLRVNAENFSQILNVISETIKELLQYKNNPKNFTKMHNPFLANTTKTLFNRVFFVLVDFILEHDIVKFRELFLEHFKLILIYDTIEDWNKLDNIFQAISIHARRLLLEEIEKFIDSLDYPSRELFFKKMDGLLMGKDVQKLRFFKKLHIQLTLKYSSYLSSVSDIDAHIKEELELTFSHYYWGELIESVSDDNFLSTQNQTDFIDLLLDLYKSYRKLFSNEEEIRAVSIVSIATLLHEKLPIKDPSTLQGQKMHNSLMKMYYHFSSKQTKESIAALEMLPKSEKKSGQQESQPQQHESIFEIVSKLCQVVSDMISREYQKETAVYTVLASGTSMVRCAPRMRVLLDGWANRSSTGAILQSVPNRSTDDFRDSGCFSMDLSAASGPLATSTPTKAAVKMGLFKIPVDQVVGGEAIYRASGCW